MTYNLDTELDKLLSKAFPMYSETGLPSVNAFYGPYSSLNDAIDYFTQIVQEIVDPIPAGIPIVVTDNNDQLNQYYIFKGGTVTAANFLPVIIDSEYGTLKAKINGIETGAEVNVVKSVDTTATNGVNLSLDNSGKLDVVISAGTIASGNTSLVTGGTVYSTTNTLAKLASPTFTGTPKAPTAAAGTNTTQIATTAFVTSAVSTAIGDTVDEVSLDQNYTNKVNIGYTLTKGGGGTLEIEAATDTTAGVMTKDDRLLLNLLIPVVESGGWNVDLNFQVGGSAVVSSGSTIPANLEARLTRIEAVLGDLYDDEDTTGASDGHFEIS